MSYCLYYSVTINEPKEKFEIVFCCFSGTRNLAVQSSYSKFPLKIICLRILAFACLDKSIPISL